KRRAASRPTLRYVQSRSSQSLPMRSAAKHKRRERPAAMTTFRSPSAHVNYWRKLGNTCPKIGHLNLDAAHARRIAANIAKLPAFFASRDKFCLVTGGVIMRQPLQPPIGKAVTNESKYPYIVEIAFDDDKLDVKFSRRIMGFHRSRKIETRHGRSFASKDQTYFRWCFSDLATARAFMEQFGGELLQKS